MRINKVLALAKIASRRSAEQFIREGRVSCNGVVITELGMKIQPHDRITVDGKEISIPYENTQYTYIILNKPIEYISSVYDPQGRRTVLSLLPPHIKKEKVYPMGRLDYFSEGLLLLSNDGDMTYYITHPKYHVEKEYRVTVRSPIDKDKLKLLHKGYKLSTGEYLAAMKTRIIKANSKQTVFSIILSQGINRQIRKICADMEWVILRLERIRIGNLSLEHLNIAQGEYRIVTKEYLLQHCVISDGR